MRLPLPITATYDKVQKISTLQFDEKEFNGDYMMRGAIAWPVQITDYEVTGMAIVAGYHIRKQKVYIFMENHFNCIDHILDENKLIKFMGIAPWFNEAFMKFYCMKWYYHEHSQTHRKYMLNIRRSAMINPKPHFIELDWNESDDMPLQVIREWMNREKLIVGDYEGGLYDEMKGMKVKPEKYSPELKALKTLLIGLDKFPYRKRVVT
ncbi:MAG: hypothetical protein GY861_28060 [bacterium]|nr:hypothetical protein [bacterium]